MKTDPRVAYRHEPTFRHTVDTMLGLMVSAQLTPGEMRQAATLAATLYAERYSRPLYPTPTEATDD